MANAVVQKCIVTLAGLVSVLSCAAVCIREDKDRSFGSWPWWCLITNYLLLGKQQPGGQPLPIGQDAHQVLAVIFHFAVLQAAVPRHCYERTLLPSLQCTAGKAPQQNGMHASA